MEWNVPNDRSWLKFWPKGVPKSFEYPQIPLWEFLTKTAAKYPERTAMVHDEQRITYHELVHRVNQLAIALEALGVQKGDRVLLFLHNVPEYIVSYYGILRRGAIVVPVNPLMKEAEFSYIFVSAKPTVLIMDENLFSIAEPTLKEFSLKNVLIVGAKDVPTGTQAFNTVLERFDGQPTNIDFAPIDPAVIQYTGGTTGMPKGAILRHFNLVANAFQNCIWFNWTEDDVVMGTLPLYHSWGACCNMNSTFAVGATLLLITRFVPELALAALQKEKVTVWYGPPTLFTVLINHPTITDYDLSSLRYVKIGAAPIPEEVRRQWEKLTGGVQMVLGYGLTEACPETLSSPPDDVRPGTVGIPIMDTDIKIVDMETGTKELPLGEPGELIVRGPQVMKGYWNDPDQTKHSLRDGWLYTGDLARIDEDGYITIVDRLKHTIKYKGYSVFPAEVENILYSHPSVRECAVVGKPESFAGEIPKAFVVLKEGHTMTEGELIEYCRENIAPYKRIREVEFVADLPKTAVGKILVRQLREQEREKYSKSQI